MAHDDAEGFGEAVTGLAVAALRAHLLGESVSASGLLRTTVGDDVPAALREKGACFVTLTRDGRLRGCIGSLMPGRRLHADIVGNTRKAANDPRMDAVAASEWPALSVSVSVLSPAVPLEADSLDSLYAALRPGIDGLTLKTGLRRATFLPSVWGSLKTPEEFVAALLRKGGWADDAWPDGATAERYGADSYTSRPPRPALEET